jgi:hypothetical protein
VLLVVAQDAQARPGPGDQGVPAVPLDQAVIAVAEEGEVVLGEPLEQCPALGDLLLGQPHRGRGRQLGRDLAGPLLHLRPVLDGDPDVLEHRPDAGDDRLPALGVGLPVDLDVDPGLHEAVAGVVLLRPVGGADLEDLQQPAGDVAPDDDLRVDQKVDPALLPGELGGHGVDEEGHVVGDDLDHGVPARPAAFVDRRGEHPHVRRALRPLPRQLLVRQRRPGEVERLTLGKVLHRDVPVVALEERAQPLVPVAGPLGGLASPVEKLAPSVVVCRRALRRLRRPRHALASTRSPAHCGVRRPRSGHYLRGRAATGRWWRPVDDGSAVGGGG